MAVESPKEIREELTKGEMEVESSDDTEDDDEQLKEDQNKAVQWTEDDQKNLTNLGISEIERNKRLESLIARRRSRKLLSFQVRRTMRNDNNYFGQITALHVLRNNPFLSENLPNQFSPGPGSAPSVLLPTHNPFDLPYDPYEEKPNLTRDSFHQEFTEAHQKEILSSRHENFSLGVGDFLPAESTYDKQEAVLNPDVLAKQRPLKRTEYSKLDKEPDDKQIQQESPRAAPFSEGVDPQNHAKKEGESSKHFINVAGTQQEDDENESQTKVVVDAFSDTEANLRANESAFEKIRNEDRLFHANSEMDHTRANSIASDLQVEVSEVGSPPRTNVSSQDEESNICDEEMEKEISSGGEEIWALSSHLSRGEESELQVREIREVSNESHKASHYLFGELSYEKMFVPVPEEEHLLTEELAAKASHNGNSTGLEELSSSKMLSAGIHMNDNINDSQVPITIEEVGRDVVTFLEQEKSVGHPEKESKTDTILDSYDPHEKKDSRNALDDFGQRITGQPHGIYTMGKLELSETTATEEPSQGRVPEEPRGENNTEVDVPNDGLAEQDKISEVEHAPFIASSSSSSPTSVLHPKLMSHSSLVNLGDETHVEDHPYGTETEIVVPCMNNSTGTSTSRDTEAPKELPGTSREYPDEVILVNTSDPFVIEDGKEKEALESAEGDSQVLSNATAAELMRPADGLDTDRTKSSEILIEKPTETKGIASQSQPENPSDRTLASLTTQEGGSLEGSVVIINTTDSGSEMGNLDLRSTGTDSESASEFLALEPTESSEDLIQDLFKALKENPRS